MAILSGDVMRISARQKLEGVFDIVNVFHVIVDTLSTGGDANVLNDLAEYVGTTYAQLAGSIPSVVDADVIDFYNVSQDIPYGQHTWGGGYTGGSNSGDFTSVGSAILLLLPTAAKRVQGRFYLGPIAEGHISAGQVNSSSLPNVENFAANLLALDAYTNGGVFDYIVLSKAENTPHHPVSHRVVLELAYQRRRRRGRGS